MSDDNDTFSLNTKNLDGLLKSLKSNMRKARVGILGEKTVRNNALPEGKTKSVNAAGARPKKFDASTNAAIGAIHEFGIPGKMPVRSFLRVPIAEHLNKELENSKAFSDEEMKNVIKEGSTGPWLQRIGILAEKIVMTAFETGGYGKWPKWKKGYENNTGDILVDTQQLKRSITSDVK